MTGVAEKFIRENSSATTDECILWPFSTYKNGYGQCWFSGRLIPAHRAMAIVAIGNPPTPRHQAAHSCGVRTCVNPLHLRWMTQSQNELDKRRHGTAQIGERNGGARLRIPQVLHICSLLSSLSDREIGPLFGVDRKTISAIRFGKTWTSVTNQRRSA